ncbi:tripartite tricarboxylate transporter TctB family protein [Salibacterium aidingense]|uniref:tripartite tricarboxylate transporter TctB family protein n=1 Tax=Salibacterium aidingense TaxID=384933 RepID=UPI000408AF36
MIILSIAAIFFTKDFVDNIPNEVGPRFYPILVAVLTILLSLLQIVSTFRQHNGDTAIFSRQKCLRVIAGLLFFMLYFYAMQLIGFFISTLVFMIVFMWSLGLRDWKKNLVVPLLSTSLIFYVFYEIFSIRLPEILF